MFCKIKIGLVIILALSFSLNSFASYNDLVGKWVKINGPCRRNIIGLASNEKACDRMSITLRYGSRDNFEAVLDSFDVLKIKNHVSALVLDVELFEDRARVVILSGVNKGVSGWIPLSWLDGNESFPTLTYREP
jgi:hypothetical protein